LNKACTAAGHLGHELTVTAELGKVLCSGVFGSRSDRRVFGSVPMMMAVAVMRIAPGVRVKLENRSRHRMAVERRCKGPSVARQRHRVREEAVGPAAVVRGAGSFIDMVAASFFEWMSAMMAEARGNSQRSAVSGPAAASG
jgi:hypothetical protein